MQLFNKCTSAIYYFNERGCATRDSAGASRGVERQQYSFAFQSKSNHLLTGYHKPATEILCPSRGYHCPPIYAFVDFTSSLVSQVVVNFPLS